MEEGSGAPPAAGGAGGGHCGGGGAGGSSGGGGVAGGGGGGGFGGGFPWAALAATSIAAFAAGYAWTTRVGVQQPQEQQPQEQQPPEVGTQPGPYPGVRLPRRMPVPGEVVTYDNVHVGLVVRRGPDWDAVYPNWIAAGRDGGPGSDGVVTSVSKSGMSVFVRWRATGEETCCIITGRRGLRELVVAPAAEVQQVK